MSELLTPGVVDAWRRRVGVSATPGPNRTRRLHRVGAGGLAEYMPALDVTPLGSSAEWEEYAYWRPLSVLMTFALLRTPCATARTERLIGDYPSDFVVVATQRLPVSATLDLDGQLCTLGADDRLVIVDNRAPYTYRSSVVADPVGIWVPTELLASELEPGAGALSPIVLSTPFASAVASFITNLAYASAVRGADIDLETELGAVDLVRAVIRQRTLRALREGDNASFVREAAMRLIDENYRDPDFDVDEIARRLYMSRRQLYRQLATAGFSPAESIVERRLELAHRMLADSDGLSVAHVAKSAGFVSTGALRNRFRARYGVTPNEFRQKVARS
ncbi:helix-turn-helix domain-containing protein [Gordonia aichiensis]|uniref:Putative AraC family transcriptional regulator n=1 Tax=Gordonia aichiensis NBRC 108223 TaxID=1220583 RepID=L7KIZ8_9ACTN|nr:AraC family transcriptional regulator [Gordonia aichiensis]GAC47688.1 putative AraC family transcriptional regulator [Gordonia aichiensis NBRC 108223]